MCQSELIVLDSALSFISLLCSHQYGVQGSIICIYMKYNRSF